MGLKRIYLHFRCRQNSFGDKQYTARVNLRLERLLQHTTWYRLPSEKSGHPLTRLFDLGGTNWSKVKKLLRNYDWWWQEGEMICAFRFSAERESVAERHRKSWRWTQLMRSWSYKIRGATMCYCSVLYVKRKVKRRLNFTGSTEAFIEFLVCVLCVLLGLS